MKSNWKLALSMLAVASTVLVAQPSNVIWFPDDEPIPFMPDDAKWIGACAPMPMRGWAHTIYLRKQFTIHKGVRRAVLIAAPFQTIRVYLNGDLIGTAHDEREASPLIVDVTRKLRRGENFITAKVFCVWRPMFYAQLRVEYIDGAFRDFITDSSWECTTHPKGAWHSSPTAGGAWQSATEITDYYGRKGEAPWGHQFALMPREMLRDYLRRHNRALKRMWARERNAPRSQFRGRYKRSEYARRFRDYLKLDPNTGKLIDADGRPLYLFFTIYNQRRDGRVIMSLPDFDFDQLERDLELMERARVNIYLRMLGWNWLLTKDGEWAPLRKQPKGTNLPKFKYGYELFDYFLDRAQSHGLYVIVEADFYWGANYDVIPTAYLRRYYLYPELAEAQALATRKIMRYLSSRKNLLALVVGEEDLGMAYDLSNPHFHAMFVDYLRRKYGTLEKLKAHWTHGYDFTDHSQFRQTTRRAEFWEGNPTEKVILPLYPYRHGVFDDITDWNQIPLPHWTHYRYTKNPNIILHGHRSFNNFTPYDPMWIDYYEFREDELLFKMLHRWASIVKRACPKQLLFYSNPQDFTASWHFYHFFRRAEIPFDVVGVGCHDEGRNLNEVAPWATIRKVIKVVAPYRPYVLAKGSLPKGIASGEGMGGHSDQPQEVLNYYRSTIFDELGSGCAWTQTYHWLHISGADAVGAPHFTPLLRWLSEFLPIAEHARFSLQRTVPILIVRNANLARSNRSGLDYGNARSLANFIGQLNIEFDIAMDRDLCYRSGERFKIDLANYRLIFLPNVSADYPDAVWDVLDAWLSDERHSGERALCIGLIEKRSPHLAPQREFHPILQRWLGIKDYAGKVPLRGEQVLTFVHSLGRIRAGTRLKLNFGRAEPTGTFNVGEPLLKSSNGAVVAATFEHAGNKIFAFGFPLGLAYHEVWGLEPRQPTYNALTPLLEGIVDEIGIERHIRAPHNVRVYVSDDYELILVKERFGIPTDIPCEIKLPKQYTYINCRTERLPDGFTRFHAHLSPYGGMYFRRLTTTGHEF